jgi:hypothetical protein
MLRHNLRDASNSSSNFAIHRLAKGSYYLWPPGMWNNIDVDEIQNLKDRVPPLELP